MNEPIHSLEESITCYIGLTITSHQPLSRVNEYLEKACALFGYERSPFEEVYITLVPPFHVDLDTALKISVECSLSTLSSKSITNSTLFSMKSLSLMTFEGRDILHFPIVAYEEEEENIDFIRRVQLFRQQMKEWGAEIRQPLPSGYKPHITVLAKPKIGEDRRLKKIIKESERENPLYFRATYPTVYAKYKNRGYRPLAGDPNDV